jgi:hypothetical protein
LWNWSSYHRAGALCLQRAGIDAGSERVGRHKSGTTVASSIANAAAGGFAQVSSTVCQCIAAASGEQAGFFAGCDRTVSSGQTSSG